MLVLLIIAILFFGVNNLDSDPFQASAVQKPAFPPITYSIQSFIWWDKGHVGLHLDLVQLLSFSHVKQIFAWQDLEPRKGQWDFSQADRLINEIEQRDMQVIARLGITPEWAYPEDVDPGDAEVVDTPPADLDDWANYCGMLSERYKGRIAGYQVWNEPNLSREWGGRVPDAVSYAEMLAQCSTAIRQHDPEAIIISAGLAPTGNYDEIAHRDDIYLDQLYQLNFQDHIDVVGVHAPGFSAPSLSPDTAEQDGVGRWFTFRRVEDLRKIMIEHDDAARQMAILEMGWTTDTVNPAYAWFAIDEATQAQHLAEAFIYIQTHWTPWVGLVSMIYMPDTEWTPADEEYWWAIYTPDGEPRPAFFALAQLEKRCGDFVVPSKKPNSVEARGLVTSIVCP